MAGAEAPIVLCIGVGTYDDKKLVALPAAPDAAKDVAAAFRNAGVKTVYVNQNPGTNADLFVAIQKAAREAKRRGLVLFYAGHMLRRDNQLLLCVGDSEVAGSMGCVPFSDVEDVLLAELVKETLIILDGHQPDGGGAAATPRRTGIQVVGRALGHQPGTANTRIRAVGEAIEWALSAKLKDVKDYLRSGRIDGDALTAVLDARVPAKTDESCASSAKVELALRDLSDELAKLAAEPPPAPTPPAAEPVVEAKPEPAAAEEKPAEKPEEKPAEAKSEKPAEAKAVESQPTPPAAEPEPEAPSPPATQAEPPSTTDEEAPLPRAESEPPARKAPEPSGGVFLWYALAALSAACVASWYFMHQGM